MIQVDASKAVEELRKLLEQGTKATPPPVVNEDVTDEGAINPPIPDRKNWVTGTGTGPRI